MTRIRIAAGATIGIAVAALVLFLPRRDPWLDLIDAVRANARRYGRLAAVERESARRGLRPRFRSGASEGRDVRALAGAVLAEPASDHHRAVAEWLAGRGADAELRLRTIATSSYSADAWNDLAVVLSATAPANDETLIEALSAADRAIDLDPSLLSARFNRASIIERLGLRDLARNAYVDYLRMDGTSEWASEARLRLQSLERRSTGRMDWRERLPSLRGDAMAADVAAIQDAVAASPQDARTFALSDLLPAWGEAVERGDPDSAQRLLAIAKTIGEELRRANGDGMVADAAAVIDLATADRPRRAALASAHAMYGRAAGLYRERRIAESAALFAEARKTLNGAASPVVHWAAYFCASAAADVGEWDRALSGIDALEGAIGDRYPTLRAQGMRLRGTLMAFDGFVGDALVSYRAARELFLSLDEKQNAVDLAARIAAALAVLGRPGESWALHRESLAAAGGFGSGRLVQSALHAAMFVAMEEERWDLAHSLLGLEVDVEDGNPRVHAEAVVWRALTAQRAGMTRAVATNLDAARRAVRVVVDPTFREGADNDLRLVEALLIEERSPEAAHALLTEYIAVSAAHHRLSRMPQVLVARARTLRRMARTADAESDLRRAIELVEAHRGRIGSDLVRDTFLGKASAAYVELADLLDARGDVRGAMEAADRARARVLVERRGGAWPAVRRGAVLLTFGIYRDRVVVYALTHDGEKRYESRIAPAALHQAIGRIVDAARGDRLDDLRMSGRVLHEGLIEPASSVLQGAEKIVLVPDAPLDRVPFAALVQADGRFLVEDHVLALAPAIAAHAGENVPRRARNAFVAIGNPTVDRRRHPSLPALDAAEEEAKGAAGMYADASLILGAGATRARTVSALGRARVAHFGTHAIADAAQPDRSRLVLAGGDELLAADIAQMSLRDLDTVVLAGCRTASGGGGYGFVQSLAAAFQAAGARHVIGSLWDIDDIPARDLTLALHRSLSEGLTPDRALREAQLQALPGRPSAWAALQVYEGR